MTERAADRQPAANLRIGPIVLDAPVVLAPMAGVTDHAFRTLCRSFAPGLLYVSEMITARALVEDSRKTFALLPPTSESAPRSKAASMIRGSVSWGPLFRLAFS